MSKKPMNERIKQHERNIFHNRAIMLDYTRRMEARDRKAERVFNAVIFILSCVALALIVTGLWGFIAPAISRVIGA